jgi:hypothetical protein
MLFSVAFDPKYRTNWKGEGREEMDIALTFLYLSNI